MTGDGISQVQNVNAWVSLATTLACLAFVAAYAVLAKWWTSYEGKVMMGIAATVGLLTFYTFLVVKIMPDSTTLRGARTVLVGLVGLFMIFQTATLIRRQLRPDDDTRAHHKKEAS